MSDTRDRLTRAEQRERTRERILDAAEQLFAAEGISAASIEQISEAAGYSRGAFYSNFDSKDALVAALLARRKEADAIELAVIENTTADPEAFFRRLRERESDPDRHALSLEFILYAVRNPSARPDVARILAASRTSSERLIAQQWAARGVTNPPVDVATAAKAIEALDDGLDLQRLIDPDEFPLGLYTDLLVVLLEAVVALSERDAER